MPRTPSFIHHRVHEHRAAPYHLDNLRVPPTSSFISSATPSPTSTLVQRSYPPSSAGTSPSPTRRDLSPFETPAKPKHNAFAADGELYPYVKGKKVSNAQLAQLLQWFKEDENPAKDARVLMANQLQMSFKALSIWYQNERANVKKGRARVVPKPPQLAKLPPPTYISTRRPSPGQYPPSSWSHRSDTDEEDELDTPEYAEMPLPEVRVESAELDEEGLYVATILASLKRS